MRRLVSWLLAVAGLAIVGVAPDQSHAANLTPLVGFNSADGATPLAGLIADDKGNLFGTTFRGGAHGDGTVFEIVRTREGYASTPTTLVSFCSLPNCADGANPQAGLIADTNGNLFGTTSAGGAHGGGTVFEVAKTVSGYASTPTTLVSFCSQANCTDGANPFAALIADAQGNLFGTTVAGGANNLGTAFEVVKAREGYASTPTILVSFCALPDCADGANPIAALIADAQGNLFGTASDGGTRFFPLTGTVFEIVKTRDGYSSTPTTLVKFCSLPNCADGAAPESPLIADAQGNLFGTTAGGGANKAGTVFEIVKAREGYASTPTTLVSFCSQANCADGVAPTAGLIADAQGDLFGTTSGGNTGGDGTLFEIVKTASGYASTPTTLVSFCSLPNCADGANPDAGLIADASGNLFGTTSEGGAKNIGTAFEVTDSGFVVRHKFAGAPGKPNCFGQSVSALVRQYVGLNAAAEALDYPSVPALQEAIIEFCESDEVADHRNQEHH